MTEFNVPEVPVTEIEMLTTFTRTDHVCILGVMVGAVVVVVVVVVVEIVVGGDDVVAPILVRT